MGKLNHAFDSPEAKQRYVRRLFGTIAERYDLITVLLSFGRDRAWKRRLIAFAGVVPGTRVLDLACGTGDIAFEARAAGATVFGLDVTPRMIALARRKSDGAAVHWLIGDMTGVPVAAGTFDAVTTGYGIRNVPDLQAALREAHRVLRPGGRFCSLDFDRPSRRWLRAIVLGYLTTVGSTLGWALHRDPDTYRYIPASIRRYPGSQAVAAMMREAGFVDVQVIPVFGGFMAIHVGSTVANER